MLIREPAVRWLLGDVFEIVLQEPAGQFWGARDFAVRDLAGNTVRIEQA